MPGSLTDILTGNYMGEQDYLAQDPFFTAGRGISQIQTGAPRNNTEAFLIPLLQNTVAGGLAGYGRRNATERGFSDLKISLAPLLQAEQAKMGSEGYTADPFLAPLLGDEMPEGFTLKQAQQINLIQALKEQQKIEAQGEAQKIVAKALAEQSMPYLSAIEKGAEAKAKGTRSGEGAAKNIPAAIMGEVADQAGIVSEARQLANDLAQSGKSWKEIQGAGMFSGLDSEGIAARVADLSDRVMRSRTGATAPPAEAAAIKKFIAGDRTAGPQQMANLLAKFADREAANAKTKIEIASSQDPTALLDAKATTSIGVPTGQTVGGKPVLKLPDGRLVIEE